MGLGLEDDTLGGELGGGEVGDIMCAISEFVFIRYIQGSSSQDTHSSRLLKVNKAAIQCITTVAVSITHPTAEMGEA